MSSKFDRDKFTGGSKNLKEAGPAYKKVYVRKDTHPAIRNEWKRLKDEERNAKDKPENAGARIVLDFKSRVLKRNDIIIDRWNPQYFR